MLLDHNHKSTCKFAEDIVAYLYGEINKNEKLRFEQHLTNCNSCTDELSGFSMVRTSVLDWHNEEFSHLATPVIEIPYEQNVPVRSFVAESNNSPSLISKLRAFFSFSPVWTTALTGVAVLLVCIGLFFIAINSQRTDDRASTNKIDSNDTARTTPTVENKNADNKVLVTDANSSNGDESKHAKQNSSDKPEITSGKSNPQINQPAPIKVSVPSNSNKQVTVKPQKINASIDFMLIEELLQNKFNVNH